MPVDFENLMNRATGGQKLDKGRIFHPSSFREFVKDPYWIWCQYHAPADSAVDETTRFDRYLMFAGSEWEETFVASNYPDAYEVRAWGGFRALRETLEAMLRGEPAIHGAALWLLPEDVYGKADLLVRSDNHDSDLGPYHYHVKEIKSARKVEEEYQLQATAYTWILDKLQGFCPPTFDIVLGEDKGVETFAYAAISESLHNHLAQWRAIRDGALTPTPIAYDSTPSPWRRHANKQIWNRNDLSMLPSVGGSTAARIRQRGIQSIDDVYDLGPDGCREEFNGDHHYYHALAYKENRPVFKPGESVSIQRRKRLVHFDLEVISVLEADTVTRAHTYMIGVATPDEQPVIWTAHGEDDEARMWTNFLDWLGDPSEVALYCWSNYEFGKLQDAANDHPQLAERILAAKAALIDLKEEIKHRPYFPVPSYSIKSVAPICGFNWSQADVDGRSAQLMYIDWLKTDDDTIIQKVVQYNREDVLAMLAVDEYVNAISPA